MFKRIIVATDLSLASDALLKSLGGLKAFGAEEVLILQFISLQGSAAVALTYSTMILEKSLQYQKEIVEKQGFKAEARTITESARSELNKIAQEEKFSLVVVGAQKHSAMGEIFFGGLAYDVIHHSRRPVLLIRLKDPSDEDLSCIDVVGCDINNHILFVTDFSENAYNAFSYVKKMVSEGAKKITLFHVQDKSKIDPYLSDMLDEFNEIDNDRLLGLKKELLEKHKAEIDIKIVYGSPPVEIIKAIKELGVQLVVMGSQGRGYVKELFLGSVSNNVARSSDASVLLIPAKREIQ